MPTDAPPTDAAALLELRGVTKRFGGVTALDEVDFNLFPGEIHALLGENGAGKSTLIKVLGGIHAPDAGDIVIGGSAVAIPDVATADGHGIRVIHQELSLAPNLTIAENIYLGREPHRLGWLDRKRMFADAETLVERLGLDEIARVRQPVGDLNVAHRQLVEIARALSSDARILVLDEPTSSLSESETEALFQTLDRLRSQGVGIIYISHRLAEIIRLADRITVLRDGHSIGTQETSAVDQRALIRWMVGRDIGEHFPRPAGYAGDVALTVRDLTNEHVRGVSIDVRYGEILGIAGLVGSGRSELVRAIYGVDPVESGSVEIDGEAARIAKPGDALEAGIVLVPEDRQRDGLVMLQSVAFNLALPWTSEWSPGLMPDARKRAGIVQRAIDGFGIRLSDPAQPLSSLSGGNQQKVLVGRWMEHRPKVLLLDEPTRGVDVGAREEMFAIIASLVEGGMAAILISSDLGEVLNMSHRIAVYRDGRVLREARAEDIMADLTGASEA